MDIYGHIYIYIESQRESGDDSQLKVPKGIDHRRDVIPEVRPKVWQTRMVWVGRLAIGAYLTKIFGAIRIRIPRFFPTRVRISPHTKLGSHDRNEGMRRDGPEIRKGTS